MKNVKKKSILEFWEWILEINKGKLKKRSDLSSQFSKNLYDFLNGDDYALVKLCNYQYYPHLDNDLVRENFTDLIVFYGFIVQENNVYPYKVEECSQLESFSRNFNNETRRMFHKEQDTQIFPSLIEEIVLMLYSLQEKDKSIDDLSHRIYYDTDKTFLERDFLRKEWQSQLMTRLSQIELDLSDNYQQVDFDKLLKDVRKASQSELRMKKYFNQFSQSSNRQTQLRNLKFMLTSYYLHNTKREIRTTSTTDILHMIEITNDFEDLRILYTSDYRAFKHLVQGFDRFYKLFGKGAYDAIINCFSKYEEFHENGKVYQKMIQL